jgi:hypothetical protein
MVEVGTTAVPISSEGLIQNFGPDVAYVGESSVSLETGVRISAGASLAVGYTNDYLFAVSEGTSTIRFLSRGRVLSSSSFGGAGASYPTPLTTGVPSGTTLTPHAGGTLAAGTYTNLDFASRVFSNGSWSYATPAIFIGCNFADGINNFQSGGGQAYEATDCTAFCETDFAFGAQNYTLLRCKVIGNDGLRWSQHGTTWPRSSVTDCFIKSTAVEPSHGDGVQSDYSEQGIDFVNCTVDITGANTTACIFAGDGTTTPAGQDGIVVDSCLIVADGAYGTKMSQGSNHKIRNTLFANMAFGEHNDENYVATISEWINNRLGTVNSSTYEVISQGEIVAAGP